ncbi:MAG TPA: hypothetical protein VLM11_10295 [Streptosporangiaceae bacterium]|nr:hypothetical protein [Streptosporangiaceae bacterium]
MNVEQSFTRDDFGKLTPVLVAAAIPPLDRVWSDADWRSISQGHKSADMDDKWNAFVEGHKLYMHRSWTGRGIYEAWFAQVPGGWRITAAVVEGDRTSYRRHDDAYESALLEVLIDGTLLGVYHGPSHERWARIRAELGMT